MSVLDYLLFSFSIKIGQLLCATFIICLLFLADTQKLTLEQIQKKIQA
jgi:hypothetical protein